MRARVVLTRCILMSVLVVPWARGQNPPKATSSSSSFGLLLAYVSHQRSDPSVPSVVRYKTLLVISDASGTQVAATFPDVIVPRKAGFWRVGIEHTCQFSPPAANDPQGYGTISTQDIGYAVPVEKPPVVELESRACDSKTTKRVLADSYDPNSNGDASAPSECGWTNLELESVLPDLISVSGSQGDYCDPRGGHERTDMWVQSPDDRLLPFGTVWATWNSSRIKIPFDRLFGAAGHSEWIRAVSPLQTEVGPCDDDDPSDMPQTGWTLTHIRGEWRTHASVQADDSCVGSGDPKIAVPRSLTYAPPLPVSWPALEKQLPGISDVYFSPGESAVLAVQSAPGQASDESHVTSVSLFDFSGGKIGRKLLDLPACNIVMAEWATGRFVRNWTDALTALQKHGLPPPTFKLKAPSQ